VSDWVTGVFTLAGVVAGTGIGYLGTKSLTRQQASDRRQQALTALYNELHYIHESARLNASDPSATDPGWTEETPFPIDAFEGAKPYLAGVPQHIAEAVYNAERIIARWNARAEYRRNGRGSEIGAKDELSRVEQYSGTAWGPLAKYLNLGVHAVQPTKRHFSLGRR
jgi:hypothetical protein